jgi:hypothetical protein
MQIAASIIGIDKITNACGASSQPVKISISRGPLKDGLQVLNCKDKKKREERVPLSQSMDMLDWCPGNSI